MAAKTPESIGKYKVLAPLAQGGMGAVYTARHPTLDRTVIIKKLTLRGNADVRERFRREAQIMMDLRNDAIVDVYDHFREGSFYYIVLEYVDGVSLDQLIRNRRYLPERIAIVILREACRGLAYAHSRNVVHRDIKPANILISKEGDVKIVDFGIATIHGDNGNESELTREGMTLGTPSYMAPEQFQSTRSVDRRADIYSLGVVLYEMVTGKRPYPGSFTPEVIARIQRGRYQPPRKVNPKVTAFTARLIRRMLHPKVSRRIPHLDPVIRRLTRRLGAKHHERKSDEIRRYLADESSIVKTNPIRRSLRIFGATVLLLVAAAIGIGVQRDYHREILTPQEFGAIEPTVRVLKTGRPVGEQIPQGTLFLDDAQEIPPVPDGELDFHPVEEEETPRFYVFKSDRRVLPSGSYRLKLTLNGTVRWSSFELPPLSDTREHRFSLPGRWGSGLPVGAEFVELPDLPLDVTIIVRDRQSGRVIDDGVAVSILRDDRWRPLTRFEKQILRSGTVHRFRISHDQYVQQIFSLSVAPEQSSLVIDAALKPLE